jgi:protein transport protein SEC61 subunit gamma-like protein
MEFINDSKAFLRKCKRVWHTLKKPSKEEFKQVLKISAIGIALLGFFGFVVSSVMKTFI